MPAKPPTHDPVSKPCRAIARAFPLLLAPLLLAPLLLAPLLLAIAAVLMLTGFGAARFLAKEMAEFVFVPAKRFVAPRRLMADAYTSPALWFSQGAGAPGDPSRWQPREATPPARFPAAVFFIHPTTHFDRTAWNADIDDPRAGAHAETFLRGLASPFAGADELWAPRYRQATLGAFLTQGPEGAQALDAAYRDVLAAFDTFLAHTDPARPVILAGHSQGGYHLIRLLRDRVAGQPLASRIVAAYVVGWPISLAHDLPHLGLPACASPEQTGCILGWQSFGEPADTAMVRKAYVGLYHLGKQDGTPYLCTNPLTGRPDSAAGPEANLGTLVPDLSFNGGTLMPGMVSAHCSPQGFLLIGPPSSGLPQMGPLVMPGNNYHVYDIPLFWANVRADAERRTAAWIKAQAQPSPPPAPQSPPSPPPAPPPVAKKPLWRAWLR